MCALVTVVQTCALPIFAITDTQIGLLQGAVFAIAFSLGGLPMGWLVDRWNRVYIASICITIWSLATALSGIAQTFEQLAILRGITAFFEAGLAPAAFSLFSDKDRKSTRLNSSH